MHAKIKSVDLGLKDIFNFAFSIFIKNFKVMFILTLIIYIPAFFLLSYLSDFLYFIYEDINNLQNISISSFMFFLIFLFIYTGIIPLVYGFLTKFVLESLYKEGVNYKNMLVGSFGIFYKYMLTGIVYSLIVGTTILLIFPGIYFLVVFAFYPSYVAITGKMGFSPLLESKKLVKGNWFKTASFLSLNFLFSVMVVSFARSLYDIIFLELININIFEIIFYLFSEIVKMYFKLVLVLWFVNKYSLQNLDKN